MTEVRGSGALSVSPSVVRSQEFRATWSKARPLAVVLGRSGRWSPGQAEPHEWDDRPDVGRCPIQVDDVPNLVSYDAGESR